MDPVLIDRARETVIGPITRGMILKKNNAASEIIVIFGNSQRSLLSPTGGVKSIPPNTAKWLRKRYDENYNNDTSHETKLETDYSMNNKCNDVNTRNMHIT